MMAQRVVEEIKSMYGIEASDVLLLRFVKKAEALIKNYCSISFIPEALFYTWVDMSMDLYNLSFNKTETDGKIASISEGNTSITFASSKESEQSLLIAYLDTLNKFRRFRW